MIHCEFCPDEFVYEEDYRAHLKIKHADEYYSKNFQDQIKPLYREILASANQGIAASLTETGLEHNKSPEETFDFYAEVLAWLQGQKGKAAGGRLVELKQSMMLLEIGLRPVMAPDEIAGDMVGVFLLIPIRGSRWWDIDDPKWEGSYIPLIIYKGAGLINRACILVSHGKEDLWQRELADKLSYILGIAVTAREK